MAKKFKVTKIANIGQHSEEFEFVNPPHAVFGMPSLPETQSIIMKVGALREMLKTLDDKDSFRITWGTHISTKYSFVTHKEV